MRYIRTTRYTNKGDTASAEANQQAQMDFYNSMTANYNKDFAMVEGATNNIMNKLNPIFNAGPGQYGYDATEDAAIRGQAINADAAATNNAVVAANKQITASNGGAAVTPTGAQEQLKQEANIAGAQKLSTDMNTITTQGYAQGNQNWTNALNAEESTLSLMDPTKYASAATSGGNAATGAVNATVNAQQAANSGLQIAGGIVGGALGASLGNGGAISKVV